MRKITMVLMMGEKDGLEITISPEDRPDIYYAVPNLDMEKIKSTHGNEAKRELRDRLAVLAYKFDPLTSTEERPVMRRNAALDKVLKD